jgi:HlyD family secretion protein
VSWFRPLIVLLLGVALGGGLVYGFRDFLASTPERKPTRETAAPRDRINALGRLQPRGGVVAVYGPTGDRVETLSVQQGQRVTKGTVLVRLASHKERQMELTLAERQLDEARRQKAALEKAGAASLAVIDAEIEQLRGSKDADLEAQRARIIVLEAQRDQALLQRTRLLSLDRQKVEPPTQDIEKVQLQIAQLKGELDAAQALLRKTESTYKHSEEALAKKRQAADAEQTRAVAQVPEKSLEQAVTLARRRVELTEITAPVDGTILKLIAREGHVTGAQPILEMSGGDGMVVVAEVYETDIGLLHQWLERGPVSLDVTSEALTQPLHATLKSKDEVAGMIARNELFSLNPRADQDRRVVDVRGELDAESTKRAASLVGLQVNVKLTAQP